VLIIVAELRPKGHDWPALESIRASAQDGSQDRNTIEANVTSWKPTSYWGETMPQHLFPQQPSPFRDAASRSPSSRWPAATSMVLMDPLVSGAPE
jgi:hypothetical protein